jgi:DUF1680 family protein
MIQNLLKCPNNIDYSWKDCEHVDVLLPMYVRHIVKYPSESYVKVLTPGFITKISIRTPSTNIAIYPNTTYPWEDIITEEEFHKEIEFPVSLMKRVLKQIEDLENNNI